MLYFLLSFYGSNATYFYTRNMLFKKYMNGISSSLLRSSNLPSSIVSFFLSSAWVHDAMCVRTDSHRREGRKTTGMTHFLGRGRMGTRRTREEEKKESRQFFTFFYLGRKRNGRLLGIFQRKKSRCGSISLLFFDFVKVSPFFLLL